MDADLNPSSEQGDFVAWLNGFLAATYHYILTGRVDPPTFEISALQKANRFADSKRSLEQHLPTEVNRSTWTKMIAETNALESMWNAVEHVQDQDDRLSLITWTNAAAKERLEAMLCLGQREPAAIISLEELLKNVLLLLSWLARSGNKQAVTSLANISLDAVRNLQDVVHKQPALARETSEFLPAWPFFISSHPDNRKYVEECLSKLNVGGKSAVNLSANWSNVATEGQPYKGIIGGCINRVMLVFQQLRDEPWVRDVEASLPDGTTFKPPAWLLRIPGLPDTVSPDNQEKWIEVLWLSLLAATGNQPEKHPSFAGIGKARGEYRKRTQTITSNQVSIEERTGLKERFRKAFQLRYRSKSDAK